MYSRLDANANALSSVVVGQVQKTLLSSDPAIDQLEDFLAQELELSREDAGQTLYHVVGDLNAMLFPPITQIELVHTEGCNLACSYCFEKDMIGYKRMPIEVARRAIDLLFDYAREEPSVTITHFGGEPTLNFANIRNATEYAEERAASSGKDIRFDTTTNGVLLNDEIVDYFATHHVRVLLSIDGLEQSHDRFRVDRRGRGTFQRVLRGLALLKARQPWIGVKMTVMPQNAGALFDDVLGLYNLGANQFIIGHATGVAWQSEAMATYGDQLSKLFRWYQQASRADLRIDCFDEVEDAGFFGCQAGRHSIAVTVHGQISPCSKIMGFGSTQLLGKLGDVWHGLTHLKNRNEFNRCSQLQAACEDAGIAQEFQGGCFAVNYGESGDLFRPSLQEHAFTLLKRSACGGCAGCSH